MKKAIVAVAIIVLALVGLVFLLPLALNSDTLRTALARQLSEAAGAEIALNGPIHFSVVPDFGIVVEDLAYKTADGAVSVTAARSVASVEPMSLFSSQVRITGIELRSPRIVLADAAPAVSTSEPAPAAAEGDDIFKLVAGFLERLSIDSVLVADGEVARDNAGTLEAIAGDIDLRLSVPGISQPASLAVSGMMDGNRMELAADIGSLRDLLDRQPAQFSLSAKTEKPPHPTLADISASGSIQLADDGSYRIAGGEIDSIGQKMRLDASYTPGDRPFVMARIAAGTLNYSDFQPAETAEAQSDTAAAPAGAPDLSAIRTIDADIQLTAEAMQAGDAIARDVVIGAKLQNGRLDTSVTSGEIAGGSLTASLLMDVNPDVPQSSGSVSLSAIDIESAMALAGQKAPATGRLSSELQYAFFGADADTIRDSVNMRGQVSIADGRIAVPQLEGVAGQGAGIVDALNATAQIEDIRQPLGLTGTAQWNGEAVGFSTALALADLLSGQQGTASIDLKSGPLNASFAGNVDLGGSVSGKADISAASLTRALRWFGQDTGTPLGQFAFSGGISASSTQLAMTDATIGLDDIEARGSLSVATAGKPKITAALSVDTLDFGKLTGSGGGAASASAAGNSGPAPIDLSILRQFDADIRLDANQLGYGKVKVGPASATLAIADGVARLAVPQAGFYNGTVTANVTANGAGDTPSIELTAGMDGTQALPFLTDAAGFDRLEGSLKASVQVTGSGADTEAFARSLNGPVSVVFSDGAIRGIDVAGLVRNVQSLINAGYTANSEAKTEFTELSVAVNIQNGVGQANDIRLLGPFARMSGQGSIDLAAQTIDMRLDPRVVGSLDGQGGDFDVSGLGMPIIVNGSLSSPSIYPDISGILADPSRALQALSQLGGGLGGLADGAVGQLGEALSGEPGAVADGVLTDLIGQLAGGEVEGAPAGSGALLNSLVGGALGGQPTTQEAGTNGAPAGTGALLNSLVGGALGQQAPAQQPGSNGAPAGNGALLDALIGGALAQQPQAAPVAPPPAAATPAAAPSGNVPLPRPDPRGVLAAAAPPAPAPQPTPSPAPPPTASDRIVDSLVPQFAPGTDQGTTDLLKGLFNQLGQ